MSLKAWITISTYLGKFPRSPMISNSIQKKIQRTTSEEQLIQESQKFRVGTIVAGHKTLCFKQAKRKRHFPRLHREWVNSCRLRQLGIATPRPFFWDADLYTVYYQYIRHAMSSDAYYNTYNFQKSERLDFLKTLATTVRSWHDRGLVHRDFKAANILVRKVADHFQFMIIDNGRVGIKRYMPLGERIKMLVQLNTSFDSFVGDRERLRFLVLYAQGDKILARNILGQKEHIERLTQKRLVNQGSATR